MAVILALAAALANALTSVLQRSAAAEAPAEMEFRMKLITYVIRRPLWLAGMMTLTAGFVLQATALRFGELAIVQPILATEIPFLLLVMWAVMRVPIGAKEWVSGFGIAIGLGVFLGTARPTGGDLSPSLTSWVGASIAGFFVIVVTSACALFLVSHGTVWKAGLFGAAGAVCFAFAGAIMKEGAATIVSSGWAHLFETWLPYTMAGIGLVGVFLTQNAFHGGPVSASQSALTIVDPITSVLIALFVFNENIHTSGWQIALETAAFAVMAVGVVLLSRSEVITGARFDHLSEQAGLERRLGRLGGEVAGEQLPGGPPETCLG